MASVEVIGIDETSLRRGQNYITVVHDLQAKRLLFATAGRAHGTVLEFVEDLKAHGGGPTEVAHVCMDMSAAYAKGVGLALPAAAISFDRFHVVAMAGEAMNQVRAAEMRRSGGGARGAGRVASRRPTRLVWGMRKNLSGRNTAQTQAMHGLQRSNLKSARAWRLKMALRDVYAQATASNDAAVTGNALRHWLSWARRSRLEPFKKLAATLKDRLPAVVRGMLEHRSNAFVEAMNGLLQQAKRAARGYRTAANFIAVAYLRMSKRKHLPPHRTQPLHVRLPNPFRPLGTVARLR